jgi:predicted RNA methylase
MIVAKREVGLEQYFTSPKIAGACVDLLMKYYNLEDFDYVIEPSSGDGAFAMYLTDKTITIDIDPTRPAKLTMNFLNYVPPEGEGHILVVGNPPFGQRASQAFKFINHAATFCDVIAFVLPNTFHGTSFKNRMPEYFHEVTHMDVSGKWGDNVLNLSFFIYERQNVARAKIVEQTKHEDFELHHAHLGWCDEQQFKLFKDQYDFAMSQVGNIRVKDFDKMAKKGSHFFVKANKPGVREVFDQMTFEEGSNTAHKSLSKAEIIKQYKVLTGETE